MMMMMMSKKKLMNVVKAAAAPPTKAASLFIIIIFLFFIFYSLYYHQTASPRFCPECHPHNKPEFHEAMVISEKAPSFMKEIMAEGGVIGAVNMDYYEWNNNNKVAAVSNGGQIVHVKWEKASELLEWKDLFPEWIDEEEDMDGGTYCPEMPMPAFAADYPHVFDLVVAKLPPCNSSGGRDVARLQLHLITANLAAKRGRRDPRRRVKVAVLSQCRPMVEIFRCDDLKKREGDWWYFDVDIIRLQHKVGLPLGSCNLALPLWEKGVEEVYNISKVEDNREPLSLTSRREAYATVLHSTEAYVCGAITLAQSLLRTGTKRDLILLLDKRISPSKRDALARSGWKLRFIKRIRNPRSEKGSYNEYNYSKFRLWQLTQYEKIVFVDSDVLVLRSIDLLFRFPQMSAAGNDGSLFNSGVMVIEPSDCAFRMLMQRREEIVSYNGGDQGFLNEVFVWWHRLPRRVNFLKNFWSNSSIESGLKNQLFGSDPPELYAIHYLGLKPWLCYRDYDCNWDIRDQRVYASDVAHRTWWRVHDSMDERLQKECGLSEQRKIELEWDRNEARRTGLQDEHLKINITDPRRVN